MTGARLQRAWWQPHATLSALLLIPLSWLFGAVSAVRRGAYRKGWIPVVRVRVPVVVVGNITVGGSGKTPLTLALVEALRERGYRPGVVSRGYGRRGHGGRDEVPRAVHAGDDPGEVGDEPPLLAGAGAPVWVGARRAAAAQALLAAHSEVDVIVADDGLQHYALARDVEIAVVDAARGIGNGLLLPAGPLRESPSRLASVDAVVELAGGGALAGQGGQRGRHDWARLVLRDALSQGVGTTGKNVVCPWFLMTQEPAGWRNVVDPGITTQPEELRGPGVVAIAGIGHPQRFFDLLRQMGIDAVTQAFPDHHRYRLSELAFPGARAILMTEKDAVKCREFRDARMWMLPIRARVDPALFDLVAEKLRGCQAPRDAGVPGHQGPADLRP
jgi:tetraacyldisaccharide 4'-kinase